jgi:hypothetical protein
MLTRNNCIGFRGPLYCLATLSLVAASSCSRSADNVAANNTADVVKRLPAGQEYAGFLSTYVNLKPNPSFENTKSFVSTDPAKNIHGYVAVIIDPPAIYVATDSDEKIVPDKGTAALKEYFQDAISSAVEDAFPVVHSPGPLVLRLRTAIVGVDVGQPTQGQKDGDSLERPLNIGKAGVEMELVDSETGEQIAAAVDRQNLGEGAAAGLANVSREERFRSATVAFDGWASRLRQFLDEASELSPKDVEHVEATNFPYAESGAAAK